jgi:N-methylhydantoinase B
MAGQGSVYVLNPETEKELPIPTKTDFVPVRCGDVLRVLTPGGGGWGDPLERESSKVLEDVTLGLVSIASAERDYGVVIDPDQRVVQEEKTQELRALLRRSRSPLTMIDRGERFRKLLAEKRISLTSED